MEDTSKGVLELIITALVENPDQVKVTRKVDEMGVLLTVQVEGSDAGLIIGRKGNNIQAIRTVISAIGMKNKERVHVKLDVPEKPTKKGFSPKSDIL